LQQIFEHKETGILLSGLIPVIGNAIFPWLEKGPSISNPAIRTLKSLILVDRDALLRPLMTLADEEILRSPFHPSQKQNQVALGKSQSQRTSHTYAQELLKFTNSLKEQSID
jgi:hypothetical protein